MAASAIPLSALIRDPFVASAFRRAERDNGSAIAVEVPRGPILSGGARRSQVESVIENLIAILDKMDGDENLEPYLADTYPACPLAHVDLEEDDERENDPAEYGVADEGGLAEQAPSYAADLTEALFAL